MQICLIFDLDGTLVDSEPLANQAFLDLIPELDETLESLVTRYKGTKMANILSDIESRYGIDLPSEFERRYRAYLGELFESKLKAHDGVIEVLQALPHPRCVASNAPIAKIQHALTISGLEQFFGNRIFSSYEVGAWKPDPTLFLHAAREMQFAPEECVVIEDSPVGIQAARAAGMKTLQFKPHRNSESCDGVTQFARMSELPTLIAEICNSDSV